MEKFAKHLAIPLFRHTLRWAEQNKYKYPPWFIVFGMLCCGLCAAAFILATAHPSAGEILHNLMVELGLMMIYTLFALGLMVFLSVAAWNFGKGVQITFTQNNLTLLQTRAGALDISPDILVVTEPGETLQSFAARLDAGKELISETRWVVAIPFQSPLLMVFGPSDTLTYQRDEPIFARPDLPDFDGRIAELGTMFTMETTEEYMGYVRQFVRMYREWVPAKKVALAQTTRTAANILSWASVALLTLFALPSVSAQKLDQVRRTEIANTVPSAQTVVRFSFETTDCDRIADGVKTYAKLLATAPLYNDKRGGKLLSIWAGGNAVYKAPEVERSAPPTATANVVRPYNETVPPPNGAGAFQMPDSVTSAEMAERAMFKIWKLEQEGGRAAKPWWKVVMTAFWVLFPLLLCLSLLAWLCAGTFASEGMILPHKYARRTLVFLLLFAGGVLMLNIMLSAISAGLGPIPLTILAAVLGLSARFVVTRLVPNFNPAPGNEPERMGGGRYGNNQRMLQ